MINEETKFLKEEFAKRVKAHPEWGKSLGIMISKLSENDLNRNLARAIYLIDSLDTAFISQAYSLFLGV